MCSVNASRLAAAVDHEVGAADEAATIAGQEGDRVADVGGLGDPAERDRRRHSAGTVAPPYQSSNASVRDDPGRHAVHPHLGRPLHGERLGEVDQPGLGRAVGRGARRRSQAATGSTR